MRFVRSPSFLAGVIVLFYGAFLCAGAAEQNAFTDPFKKEPVDRIIEKAVAYLISQQDKREGWIDDKRSNRTAMTSLAIMAIASTGHRATDKTPEGRALSKALDYILNERLQNKDGYFGRHDGSRMYGHGITTLMLGEMLGMGVSEEHDRLIRKRLEKAVDLIKESQEPKEHPKSSYHKGGWRYEPSSNDADLSVTVWQVMALRSAKNAGMDIPKKVINDAALYIKRTHNARKGSTGAGLIEPFAYQPRGRAEYSTAAAGVLALQVCGYYETPEVKGAVDWLLKNGPEWRRNWFFYGTYYYAQGLYQRGGSYATQAQRKVRAILMSQQRRDGSWESHHGQEKSAGKVYSTSLGILSLSVHYHFLPIYQR